MCRKCHIHFLFFFSDIVHTYLPRRSALGRAPITCLRITGHAFFHEILSQLRPTASVPYRLERPSPAREVLASIPSANFDDLALARVADMLSPEGAHLFTPLFYSPSLANISVEVSSFDRHLRCNPNRMSFPKNLSPVSKKCSLFGHSHTILNHTLRPHPTALPILSRRASPALEHGTTGKSLCRWIRTHSFSV